MAYLDRAGLRGSTTRSPKAAGPALDLRARDWAAITSPGGSRCPHFRDRYTCVTFAHRGFSPSEARTGGGSGPLGLRGRPRRADRASPSRPRCAWWRNPWAAGPASATRSASRESVRALVHRLHGRHRLPSGHRPSSIAAPRVRPGAEPMLVARGISPAAGCARIGSGAARAPVPLPGHRPRCASALDMRSGTRKKLMVHAQYSPVGPRRADHAGPLHHRGGGRGDPHARRRGPRHASCPRAGWRACPGRATPSTSSARIRSTASWGST